MGTKTRSSIHRTAASLCVLLLCLTQCSSAHAWSLSVKSGSRRLFLHVGNGDDSKADDKFDGKQGNSSQIINTVSVSVPASVLGNGIRQEMTSDSTQSVSLYDIQRIACGTPSRQVLIGAGYRTDRTNNVATLSVLSPTSLTNTTGDTIPFTEISWVAGPASTTLDIPSGTFTGGTQTLRTLQANTYLENCHTFTYNNSAVRAAGTYRGQVTYTLSAP